MGSFFMAVGTVGSFITGFQAAAWLYALILAAVWVVGAALRQYHQTLGIARDGSIGAWVAIQGALSLILNSIIYGVGYLAGSAF